jgi:TM2 domain-containing membrane protein YozV
MDNNSQQVTPKKNPALAAIISTLFPGAGFFYVGNILKGIAYIIVFILLIVMIVHASDHYSQALEIVVLGLLLAGFYIFQIVESFNDASRMRRKTVTGTEPVQGERISLFGSFMILIIGVLFQLRQLDVIELRDIIRLWPLILVGLGIRIIYNYMKDKEMNNE